MGVGWLCWRCSPPLCIKKTWEKKCVRENEANASKVLPYSIECQLILNLRMLVWQLYPLCCVHSVGLPKYTKATGAPFVCPIFPEQAFQQRWHELSAPLELDPLVNIASPKTTGIQWPWASWHATLQTSPTLCRIYDWSFLWTMTTKMATPTMVGNGAHCVSPSPTSAYGDAYPRVWRSLCYPYAGTRR